MNKTCRFNGYNENIFDYINKYYNMIKSISLIETFEKLSHCRKNIVRTYYILNGQVQLKKKKLFNFVFILELLQNNNNNNNDNNNELM